MGSEIRYHLPKIRMVLLTIRVRNEIVYESGPRLLERKLLGLMAVTKIEARPPPIANPTNPIITMPNNVIKPITSLKLHPIAPPILILMAKALLLTNDLILVIIP